MVQAMVQTAASLVSALIGGVVVAVTAQYLAPRWLRRSVARTSCRAGLQAIKVYVMGALEIPSHQHLQTEWSHICAARFGEVAAHAAELAPGDELEDLATRLAGWLARAPFLAGNDDRVNELGEHLKGLERALAAALLSDWLR